ncbi:MAG: M1 family metallopeptidase [Balneolaceae bacterium]|nr:M1 family metallopeptidase [Balneolaceae bacterium]
MKFFSKPVTYLLFLTIFIFSSCSTSDQVQEPSRDLETLVNQLERPLPYPVHPPASYQMAVNNGTRTETGEPGENYWQNYSYYTLHAEIDPETNMLHGNSQVTFENNSPQSHRVIVVEIAQNLHKAGLPKNEYVEITGGVDLTRITVEGSEIEETNIYRRWTQEEGGYILDGTTLYIYPEEELQSGESMEFGFEWSFEIPEHGAAGDGSGRMGRSNNNLYYIAYWYPKIAVYDDVIGWFNDPFLGKAEFYHGFADYDVTITAPEDWLVMSTGEFMNPGSTLSEKMLDRYRQAGESDEVITIADFEELDEATIDSEDGKLTWRFQAYNVRDVAFSATLESKWESARTEAGDVDGDGEMDYTRINTFYREPAKFWTDQTEYAQHSIDFLAEYTGKAYPWPHMTSVEGSGIIGGGMEHPMMTLIGDYNSAGTVRLYGVTAHELAHMWIPMILSTNERRYTWMDEGFTQFHDNLASADYYSPDRFDQLDVFASYMQIAGTELEGELMRWSDYHYYANSYSVASYDKPASILYALKGLLGDELFMEAHREFIDRWAFKHPYPWDMFRTYEDVSGRDLSWFWRSWYYETWVLDHGVTNVSQNDSEILINIEDHGNVPMPVTVQVEFEDNTTQTEKVDVEHWLNGYRTKQIQLSSEIPVVNVTVDPDFKFPDVDRSNNQWSAEDG